MTETNTELQTQEKQAVAQEGTRPGPIFRPDVDILEQADAFVIFADLPGVDETSVDVGLDKGTLTLDANLEEEGRDGWTPLHREYTTGSYHREFRISKGIDANGVSASMKNGVLELRLPKAASEQPRQIAVASG